MSTKDCWVIAYQHKNFGGHTHRFEGPSESKNINPLKFEDGESLGDNIDSVTTGPQAWFEGFEDEDYADSVIRLGPNSSIADLDEADMGDNIDSYRLYDARPPHW